MRSPSPAVVLILGLALIAPPSWASRVGRPAWRNVTTSTKPQARKHHTFVLDTAGDRAIVFGGENGTTLYDSSRVWVLNLSTLQWSSQSTTCVSGANCGTDGANLVRHGHSTALISAGFAADSARMIVITGSTDSHDDLSLQLAAATRQIWELNLTDWTWRNRTITSGSMPCKRWHSAVATLGNGDILMYGGQGKSDMDTTVAGLARDTWLLKRQANGSFAWEQVDTSVCAPAAFANESPSKRYRHALVTAGTDLFLTPGVYADPDNSYSTVFRLKSSIANTVQPWVTPHYFDHTSSFPRAECSVAYDPNHWTKRIIFYGGVNPSDANFPDVPLTSPFFLKLPSSGSPTDSALATLCASPPALKGQAMIYDGSRDRIVMFGGATSMGVVDSTWVLDLGRNPAAPTGLAEQSHTSTTLTVGFVTPDWNCGDYLLDLRTSSTLITSANFDACTRLAVSPSTAGRKDTTSRTVTVSSPSTPMYYALRVKSAVDSAYVSEISNVVCYKLSPYIPCGDELVYERDDEVEHEGPLAFSLEAPGRVSGSFDVALAVRPGVPARLDLVDIAGRIVEHHTLESPGVRGVVRIGNAAKLKSGWYALRLRQGHDVRTRSVLVIR